LRGDDGEALRLPGDGQEAFVAGWIIAADRGKVLVFIADEDGWTKVFVRFRIHLWDTQHHRTLIIDLHHGAEGLGKRWVQGHRKVQADDRAGFDEIVE
jgi:hypothetical protein